MDINSKIFITGHKGLVGSAVLSYLKDNNYTNLITQTREELDLRNQADVYHFFEQKKPEYVISAAR